MPRWCPQTPTTSPSATTRSGRPTKIATRRRENANSLTTLPGLRKWPNSQLHGLPREERDYQCDFASHRAQFPIRSPCQHPAPHQECLASEWHRKQNRETPQRATATSSAKRLRRRRRPIFVSSSNGRTSTVCPLIATNLTPIYIMLIFGVLAFFRCHSDKRRLSPSLIGSQ